MSSCACPVHATGSHSWICKDRIKQTPVCRARGNPLVVHETPAAALAKTCREHLADAPAVAADPVAAGPGAAADVEAMPALLALCKHADGAAQLLGAMLELCEARDGGKLVKVGPELLHQLNVIVENRAKPATISEEWLKHQKHAKELRDKVTHANTKVQVAMEKHRKALEVEKYNAEAKEANQQRDKLTAEAEEEERILEELWQQYAGSK